MVTSTLRKKPRIRRKTTPKTRTRKKPVSRVAPARAGQLALCIGTLKGGFLLEAGPGRRRWTLRGPFHLGTQILDFQVDPRDGKTLMAAGTGGHLGPAMFRSRNRGRTWTEVPRPPKFKKLPKGKKPGKTTATVGLAVKGYFWLTPGHADEPGSWYCGTAPQGLFRSDDGGESWKGIRGWNENKNWFRWTGGPTNETPAGALMHSIRVDPRDAKHMLLSLSVGGTFESFDRGRTWKPLNQGVFTDFYPENYPEYGQDPHCLIMHPANPGLLYQQNHCGIYRLDRDAGEVWTRIGKRMPKKIGDVGFPMVGHPTDADTVWVFPMDGTRVWPRTSPGGKPAVYRTRDGGRSWERLDRGLPRENAFFTVYRQAMDADADPRRTGLYFGTTSGDVWASRDGGESWERICEHLPKITSVRTAMLR